MPHDARQVFEIAAEKVNLIGRAIYSDNFRHPNRPGSVCTIDSERFVSHAVPGCAAPDEFASERSEGGACPAAPAQTQGSQHTSSDQGQRTLVRSDIYPGFPAVLRGGLVLLLIRDALCDVLFEHGC